MGPGRCDFFAHCFVLLVGCILRGVTVDVQGRCILDLIAALNVSRRTTNESDYTLTTGPNPHTPALLLRDSTRYLKLPDPVLQKTLRCLSNTDDFTIIATLKQDLTDSGSIVALSANLIRFLEIESSGRRDEIRLHFTHSGVTHIESFPYRLADDRWHRLAVSVSGSHVTIFVDCHKIYERVSKRVDHKFSGAGAVSLFLGQRNRQHALFRGALQDVKIVTQSHGYLLQCPNLDTNCPTCAQYQALEKKVDEMLFLYKNMSIKLEKAEKRLVDLEYCDCQKNCYYNGSFIHEGQTWRVNCTSCSCTNGSVECERLPCTATPCKHPVYTPDNVCCPVCLSHCYFQGQIYDHGESITPRVCVTCICNDGNMGCDQRDPRTSCPTLNCSEENQLSVQGECCPVCRGTDFCSQGHDCHVNASCVNLATRYACQCQTGFHGDGRSCTDVDECLSEGGRHGHHCVGETQCVNTIGSYQCDCAKGHRRINDFTCQEIDECRELKHSCHDNAICVNTRGGYRCVCGAGFTGDGFLCEPICEKPCQSGGVCSAPGVCSCRHGYMGEYCELDVDECELGIARCHHNSYCINLPGWYECHCNHGYFSDQSYTRYGGLCIDVNECTGEGGTNSCHPSTVCRNTPGGYTCECRDPLQCNNGCMGEGIVHKDGETWSSVHSRCHDCTCKLGVTSCKRTSCDCAKTADTHHQCCPHCDTRGECQHQESTRVLSNGDTWMFQCQTCECLNGEIDCWPLRCHRLVCTNTYQLPGDCCPRCVHDNPCVMAPVPGGTKTAHYAPCHYLGREMRHGVSWSLTSDPCTLCKCQLGHICCTFNQTCSEP